MVASDLLGLLGGPFRFGVRGPGGWVILQKPRVQLGDESRVPDLAAWRADTTIPDWICEILSPATEAEDRGPKMDLYARAGVEHVWLVGWIARTVEVYRRQAAGWLRVATFTGDAKVRAEPFD